MSSSWDYFSGVRGGVGLGSVVPRGIGSASEIADEIARRQREVDSKYRDLESKYGRTVDQIKQGLDGLADVATAATAEQALAGLRSTACTALEVVGAGSVCNAVMSAIESIAGWIVDAWPATPIYDWAAATNLFLHGTGYSGGDYALSLETAGLSRARKDGWVIFWRNHPAGAPGWSQNTVTWSCSVLSKSCETVPGASITRMRELEARADRGESAARADLDTLRNEVYPGGLERYQAIFGSLSPRGAPSPVVVGSSGRSAPIQVGAVSPGKSVHRFDSRAFERSATWPSGVYQTVGARFTYSEWGRTVASWNFDTMAFRLDKMPLEMKRKVRACMFAKPSEFPCDAGVRAVVRQIQEGFDSSRPEKLLLSRAIDDLGSSASQDSGGGSQDSGGGGGSEEGSSTGTVVAVVGGVSVLALLAWLALK